MGIGKAQGRLSVTQDEGRQYIGLASIRSDACRLCRESVSIFMDPQKMAFYIHVPYPVSPLPLAHASELATVQYRIHLTIKRRRGLHEERWPLALSGFLNLTSWQCRNASNRRVGILRRTCHERQRRRCSPDRDRSPLFSGVGRRSRKSAKNVSLMQRYRGSS